MTYWHVFIWVIGWSLYLLNCTKSGLLMWSADRRSFLMYNHQHFLILSMKHYQTFYSFRNNQRLFITSGNKTPLNHPFLNALKYPIMVYQNKLFFLPNSVAITELSSKKKELMIKVLLSNVLGKICFQNFILKIILKYTKHTAMNGLFQKVLQEAFDVV